MDELLTKSRPTIWLYCHDLLPIKEAITFSNFSVATITWVRVCKAPEHLDICCRARLLEVFKHDLHGCMLLLNWAPYKDCWYLVKPDAEWCKLLKLFCALPKTHELADPCADLVIDFLILSFCNCHYFITWKTIERAWLHILFELQVFVLSLQRLILLQVQRKQTWVVEVLNYHFQIQISYSIWWSRQMLLFDFIFTLPAIILKDVMLTSLD